MSKITDLLDGKISHQSPSGYDFGLVKCAKCSKQIPAPISNVLESLYGPTIIKDGTIKPRARAYQIIYHYTTTTEDKRDYYIYASKRGSSVVYCSDYCRKKHNHRFVKKT